MLRSLLLILLLLATGCASRLPVTAGVPGPSLSVGAGRAERVLWVRPQLASRVQALVAARTADDIAYLVILPQRDPGDGVYRPISRETGELLAPIDRLEDYEGWDEIVFAHRFATVLDMTRPIPVSGLKAEGRYRLTALAFDDQHRLLSEVGASSIDLVLANDDRAEVAVPLTLRLLDTPFGATKGLVLSVSGDRSRLRHLEVWLVRLEGEAGELVASNVVSPDELLRPLRLTHLQANTRYAAVVQAVLVDGELPPPQVAEFQVEQDDVLPELEVVVPLP